MADHTCYGDSCPHVDPVVPTVTVRYGDDSAAFGDAVARAVDRAITDSVDALGRALANAFPDTDDPTADTAY